VRPTLRRSSWEDPRSPIWGGCTTATVVGVVFGAISVVAGWDGFLGSAVRAAAVVFAAMSALSLPGAVLQIVTRTPFAARAGREIAWEVLWAAVLVYAGFIALR